MENDHQIFSKIGEDILENIDSLEERMRNLQQLDSRFSFAQNNDYFLHLTKELFVEIGEGISNEHPESETLKTQIKEWGNKVAQYCLHNDVSLSTALQVIPKFREVLITTIEKKCLEFNLSLHDSFYIYNTFESLLDNAAHVFSHTFLHHHIEALERAKQEMQEISVPVVPIKQGTAVLPIIGDMDDDRSEFLQQRTLERATELELSYLIIDLSGINTINTWFAQHLIQLIDALQLLGIDTSISGMRPELSQTIVQLGITFKHVSKFLTLEQALVQHTVYS
ncbi:rsbT co-antagonist protein RsbR [Salibacterium salarium]|uniref:STAS domain-containing protein n=1 Tax=Salibacterium salarium TaxID=284579 RepID=UPI00278B9346|nr:STAS domain-containing protein [Salibacterium salarium]MDQ0299947.1 rsbT co-antagonist protein RsbR [Salibacterium salarium]